MHSSEDLARALSGDKHGSLARQAGRGIMWNTVQSLVNRLAQFAVFVVLARLLVPADFGTLAAANVFVSLTAVLAGAGMSRTLVQRKDLEARHLNAAFAISVGSGVVLSLALVALAPLAARLYDISSLTGILAALSIVPLLNGISATPQSVLTRQFRFRALTVRNITSTAVGGILGVTTALLGAGAWALVVLSVSQAVVFALLTWVNVRWRPSFRTDRESLGEVFGFGNRVLGMSLLSLVSGRAPELMIGVVLGPASLGLYSVAMRVHSLLLEVSVVNIQRTVLPVFSRMQGDLPRVATAYLRATRITATVSFPCFALMALTGSEIVPVLFGDHWQGAGTVMSIVALQGPLQSLAFFTSNILLSQGLATTALRYSLVNAANTVIAFGIGVNFGITGAAIALVTGNYIVLPIGLMLVRRLTRLRVRDQVGTFLAPLCGCLVMAVVVLLARLVTDARGVPWLVTADLLALAAYLLTVHVIRPQTLSELKALVGARRKGGARHRRSSTEDPTTQERPGTDGPSEVSERSASPTTSATSATR